ncbi:DUF3997 domain-containing protein [Nonlabens ulvanivorans]|uniref:DUF3997 domain-containing protein n=1 Tax=Nonlabens ulvanivorans TaxID=906888 RepID=UPI0032651496
MRLFYLFLISVPYSTLSCTSDYTKDLGDGYFYRNEGGKIKDILCEKKEGVEVPAEILSYNYNNDLIIAKQKPKLPQDAMYSKNYLYNINQTNTYYWILYKKENVLFGPLDSLEYEGLRSKFKIPSNFQLP